MSDAADAGIDRVAFYLAFVPYLEEGVPVPVTQAAAHFGTTPEFIRDTVRRIMTLGIPGEGGLYLHGDLFDFDVEALEERDELVLWQRIAIDDVPRLSAREVSALLAGLAVLAGDGALASHPDLRTLRAKLVRGAVEGSSAQPVVAPLDAPHLAPLRDAIAAGRRVAFDYRTPGRPTARREVDPLVVESTDAEFRLRGWCRLRDGIRSFRLDRMSELTVLEDPVEHTAAELDAAADGFEARSADDVVVFEMDEASLALLAGYRPTLVERLGDRVRVEIVMFGGAEVRRLLAAAPGAVVVAPEPARRAVRTWAEHARSRYVDSEG